MTFLIVTGAASGIGAATVARALGQGFKVAALDLEVGAIPSHSALSRYRCDVSDPTQVSQAVQNAVADWGAAPTGLVHCAGVYRTGPAETVDVSTWDLVSSVNTRGSFLVAQAVGRAMLAAGRGSIVLLSSIAWQRGDEFEPSVHYSASKGAVVSLTRQLAAEWGPRGIRTNAVAPGVIDTTMTTLTKHPEQSAAFLSSLPLRRLGTADEVAAACLFLIGPDASYINGVVLPVDGGHLVS
jgi:NAD(P)-dependent dehydrogenase (short-subunit alcohol dehydrogenase family)